MIPNVVNVILGLTLAYFAAIDITWVEQQYLPLLPFAAVIFVMAMWARRNDPGRWFTDVTIAVAALLAILALLPLPTLPMLTFWGVFWAGILVPIASLWAILYRPEQRQTDAR